MLKKANKMKQHITREQWEELSDKEKKILVKYFGKSLIRMIGLKDTIEYFNDECRKITIGKLIEFLEDDIYTFSKLSNKWDDNIKGWELCLNGPTFEEDELADALWEAVKYKLKNSD